jgi:hypothetical protein
MWNNLRKGWRTPRCPYCSGLLDLRSITTSDMGQFKCPTCGKRLYVAISHQRPFIAGALLSSLVIAWALGARGLLLGILLVPLSLPILVLEYAVLAFLVPPKVRLHNGSAGLESHYETLGVSGWVRDARNSGERK